MIGLNDSQLPSHRVVFVYIPEAKSGTWELLDGFVTSDEIPPLATLPYQVLKTHRILTGGCLLGGMHSSLSL